MAAAEIRLTHAEIETAWKRMQVSKVGRPQLRTAAAKAAAVAADSKATAAADSWQLYPAETTAVSATEPSMPAVLPHAF